MSDSKSDKKLIDIGTCSLHVIHNAFRAGHKSTGWNLSEFLHSIYYLFKDSPARRADFIRITGKTFVIYRMSEFRYSVSTYLFDLGCNIFAKKFCGHRWLENVDVVERAITLIPHIKQYVETVEVRPTVGSFEKVENLLKCPFLQARLEFFKVSVSYIFIVIAHHYILSYVWILILYNYDIHWFIIGSCFAV